MKSLWRHILDGSKHGGGTDARRVAKDALTVGYAMFAFNGNVYAVTEDSNPLKYPLFHLNDLEGECK